MVKLAMGTGATMDNSWEFRTPELPATLDFHTSSPIRVATSRRKERSFYLQFIHKYFLGKERQLQGKTNQLFTEKIIQT